MNIEKVKIWIRENDLPYFRVVKGQTTCFKTPDSGTVEDLEETIQFFEKNIKLYPSGRYGIIARKSIQGHKGESRLDFHHEYEGEGSGNNINGIDFEKVGKYHDDILNAKIGEISKSLENTFNLKVWELEKQRLLDEIKELKAEIREKDSVKGKFDLLGTVVVEKLLNKVNLSPSSGVSPEGVGSAEVQEPSNELDERGNAALDILCEKLGDDTIPVLEKLAAMPEAVLRQLVSQFLIPES